MTTIGLDLAKHWFQVHGVDGNGQVGGRLAGREAGQGDCRVWRP